MGTEYLIYTKRRKCLPFIHLLEDHQESSIISLKNGVLSAHVQWVWTVQCILEWGVSKASEIKETHNMITEWVMFASNLILKQQCGIEKSNITHTHQVR